MPLQGGTEQNWRWCRADAARACVHLPWRGSGLGPNCGGEMVIMNAKNFTTAVLLLAYLILRLGVASVHLVLLYPHKFSQLGSRPAHFNPPICLFSSVWVGSCSENEVLFVGAGTSHNGLFGIAAMQYFHLFGIAAKKYFRTVSRSESNYRVEATRGAISPNPNASDGGSPASPRRSRSMVCRSFATHCPSPP
jgi:hypothetical protein